jgi:hypothetical protein
VDARNSVYLMRQLIFVHQSAGPVFGRMGAPDARNGRPSGQRLLLAIVAVLVVYVVGMPSTRPVGGRWRVAWVAGPRPRSSPAPAADRRGSLDSDSGRRWNAPMTRPLQGTVALITGASSGIGEQAAVILSDLGANVVVVARRAPATRHHHDDAEPLAHSRSRAAPCRLTKAPRRRLTPPVMSVLRSAQSSRPVPSCTTNA